MRDLSELRVDIDRVDKQIKALYNERLNLAKEVAYYKIEHGKEVFDKEREDAKIKALTEDIEDVGIRNGVRDLFYKLMSDSRMTQYGIVGKETKVSFGFEKVDKLNTDNARVIFQGEPGAYSQAAAKGFFGNVASLTNVPTWREAMEAVRNGEADYCVLPIENSTAGSITEIYDLLMEYDLAIAGEQVIPINHMLLGKEGAKLSDIKTVYSHPQALMQCEGFLRKHPEIEQVKVINTALAAKKVSEENDKTQAAIAGQINTEIYDLSVIAESIQDEDNNKTRFVILSKDKIYTEKAGTITVSFTLLHEKGSLYNALSYIANSDINLTRIESRPIRKVNWEYRFFIDMEGNLSEDKISVALMGIMGVTADIKILGNY